MQWMNEWEKEEEYSFLFLKQAPTGDMDFSGY